MLPQMARTLAAGFILSRWRAKVAAGYSGPAVAAGRVYVMDRHPAEGAKKPANDFGRGTIPGTERVLCLNEVDGNSPRHGIILKPLASVHLYSRIIYSIAGNALDQPQLPRMTRGAVERGRR